MGKVGKDRIISMKYEGNKGAVEEVIYGFSQKPNHEEA
jgi:hypothetical protein